MIGVSVAVRRAENVELGCEETAENSDVDISVTDGELDIRP